MEIQIQQIQPQIQTVTTIQIAKMMAVAEEMKTVEILVVTVETAVMMVTAKSKPVSHILS
jgi:hypothetical protein